MRSDREIIEENVDTLQTISAAFDIARERAKAIENKDQRPILLTLCGLPDLPPMLSLMVGKYADVLSYLVFAMDKDEDFRGIVIDAVKTYKEYAKFKKRNDTL